MSHPYDSPARKGNGPGLAVLVIDDEESMRHFLTRGLGRLGHEVTAVADGAAALVAFAARPFDVAVVDLRMPGMDGITVLNRLRAQNPSAAVIMMTAYGTIATAVEAMQLGAADFLQKPFELDELQLRLERAVALRRTLDENHNLRQLADQREAFPGLIGNSAAMRTLRADLDLVRQSTASVLITGESGVGKGAVARAIHAASPRRDGPFVVLSCPAVPVTLFESELFGHEAGAFTGAVAARQGLALRAQHGTLFLDEIGELGLQAQAKLERFLQEREVQPLGGGKPQRVDVRILAATNRDLQQAATAGTFRAELLFRLEVLRVHVPPLRERREDVPLLVLRHLQRIAARSDPATAPKTMTAAALAGLAAYSWPGNVRELENLAERMAVLAGERSVLDVGDLPDEVRHGQPQSEEAGSYEAARRDFDRAYFTALLLRCGGNITAAAQQAGLSRGHLHRRLRELGCDPQVARSLPPIDDVP